MHPAEAETTGNERLVYETFARFNAGRPLDDIVDPGYRAEGDRWPIDRFDDATPESPADPSALGYRMEARVVSERAPGFVFVETVWTHEHTGSRGSAGLAWSVVRVRDGLVRASTYYPTRAEAERRAEAG